MNIEVYARSFAIPISLQTQVKSPPTAPKGAPKSLDKLHDRETGIYLCLATAPKSLDKSHDRETGIFNPNPLGFNI